MHAWDVTPREAVEIQKDLRASVRIEPLAAMPRVVAGCDISFNRFSNIVFGGFVTMTWPDLVIIETAVVKDTTSFPYIPGFLSFREIPTLLKAWDKLSAKPELVFVDGVGIAHPRRLGIAAHLGVLLDVPTIGCAKSVLTGVYEEPPKERGARSPLIDRASGDLLGFALRTKDRVKPMFISPGHRIDAPGAADLVLAATRRHRMPEPTRFAHNAMNEFRVADRES